ncbi:MAG: biotin--[acetyl-CoA-carboxylase] ligase, partial [Actinobacteria bacterium]|nr:biotin--[acetyl-CoA-carboxylase] ligase [Actinomycetota bacterium]
MVELRDGNAKVGDVIVAEYQSAGRGRLDRSFEAAKGSALLFSFYIEPKRNRDDWGWIPLIAGYCVAKTLHAYDAKIKWPNDILVGTKKIAGILIENQLRGNQISSSIIGIGLIGGSIAKALRTSGWASELIGIDANPVHATKALSLRLVDEILTLEEAIERVEVFVCATPVDILVQIIPNVLDLLKPNQIVIEVGSTK